MTRILLWASLTIPLLAFIWPIPLPLAYPDQHDSLVFIEGLSPLKIIGQFGFVDINEKVIISPSFEEVEYFGEGKAGAKIGGKWGFINKKGDFVIKPQFDDVQRFSEGFAPVRIGHVWGFVNQSGPLLSG